ncbi:MAG: hypothetical protein JWR58_4651 [Pseudonocardia sp.]|jgi:uncharacterized membrane protein (DUF2068 family)|nr:hypothetical protein [Pseudonocardia sp.]
MDEDGRRYPPGTQQPTRFRPRFHYELIGCGLHGHELVGTTAAQIRPEDDLLVRELSDGLRWYRCVRCDAWVPLPPPTAPTERHLPDRAHIELPLRGRALRDRYVLRLIALDRLVHFLVLGVLAAAVFLFAADRAALSQTFYRVLDAVQGGVGGPNGQNGGGILGELQKAFAAKPSTLWIVGLVLAGYALLEGVEAIGLWRTKRWAEYLTFIATTLLLIPEIYELTGAITITKIVTLIINLVVVGYLLFAKRLFGLRGGGRAETADRDRDSGWSALEHDTPRPPHTRPVAGSRGDD